MSFRRCISRIIILQVIISLCVADVLEVLHSLFGSLLLTPKAPTPSSKESDLVAFWYKPHYQCDGAYGSTPQEAADFINKQLVGSDDDGTMITDFVGVSEWVNNMSIGNPTDYGVIGSVCGYGHTPYTTSISLFYNLNKWLLEESYPKNHNLCNFVPTPPWTGNIGEICLNKTIPDDDNCCSCVYSKDEYAFGDDIGLNLGQRPWVGGIFTNIQSKKTVCVIAGEIPHPILNSTLYNLNGAPYADSDDPKPYTYATYLCTLLNTNECIPNFSNTSILFGTDVLVPGISEFCGDNPLIFMADTNAAMGYVTTGSMFSSQPMMFLRDYSSFSSPYTCCNDTFYGGQLNAYASDRISVSGNELTIDLLQGGSIAPAGTLPNDMGYRCHSSEEHTPLRAYISFKN